MTGSEDIFRLSVGVKRDPAVGFFYGAMLEDPADMLEGSGKRMRHVKLRPGFELDTKSLRELIRAAYLDIRVRLNGELSSR